jgi:hypothetical protein
MTTQPPPGGTEQHPSEEELRAAYEAEIKKVRVEHVLLEHVVTMINLGRRRTGLAPGTEDERDPAQVQLAIEAIRAVMPALEQVAPQQAAPIRDALSDLQLAFVKIGGPSEAPGQPAQTAAQEPAPTTPQPEGKGPAQRSGKLWVPGQ